MSKVKDKLPWMEVYALRLTTPGATRPSMTSARARLAYEYSWPDAGDCLSTNTDV